jgi:peptidoglycan hydrolase CwlO-like protein
LNQLEKLQKTADENTKKLNKLEESIKKIKQDISVLSFDQEAQEVCKITVNILYFQYSSF